MDKNCSNNLINIELDSDEKYIYLKIIDNGRGISHDQISEVVKPGISLKKQSGLGLTQAKESIEFLGGNFNIISEKNKGTTIEIQLSKIIPPKWFVSEIVLFKDHIIAILDDDNDIHDFWQKKFNFNNLSIFHFRTAREFKYWYKKQFKPVQLFSDYELLGDNETGLDVIEELKINKNTTLVTSHNENLDVIKRCEHIGISLLPKNSINYVEIRFE